MKLGALHRPPPPSIRPLSERASLHLMSVPTSADWYIKCPPDGDPLGNDEYGNCVPVYRLRQVERWRANAHGDAWMPNRDMALRDYAALTGFDAATGKPDNGTDVPIAMGAWASKGIHILDQSLSMIRWATVDPANDDHLAIAIAHLGGVGITLALPEALMSPANWAQPPGSTPDWAPLSAGGYHRVGVGAFDGQERRCDTWGMVLTLHPGNWSRYVVAVDAAVSMTDWLDTTGLAPAHLDLEALDGDLKAVG